MKKLLLIIINILIIQYNILPAEEIENGKRNNQIRTSNLSREINKNKYSNAYFGLGFCYGRIGGLYGLYIYSRLFNHFSFEFAYGYRYFKYYYKNDYLILKPFTEGLKFQYYFTDRQASNQFGFELASIYSEDAGEGVSIAFIHQFKFIKYFNIDINMGLGYYLNYIKSGKNYLENKLEILVNKNAKILSNPLFLLTGIGLSIAI